MKYVRIMKNDVPTWGVLEGEHIRTLRKPPFECPSCFDGDVVKLADCQLLAPTEPTKLVCIGKNYYDHAKEMGGEPPAKPLIFLKAPNTVNVQDGEIGAPDFVERLDYEGELAVVIGKRAKHVKPENYEEYVLGYTCLNDVTARDVQYGDGQWSRGKSMDGFAPMGPVIETELDYRHARLETRLNGKVVQQGNTEQLMHSLPELLAYITQSMTMEPGDIIATGTPAGVGPMHHGDVVEVEIQGVGTLRNYVK